MLLGKITGKVTTTTFRFAVEGNAQKFDYVQAMHSSYNNVLGQIIDIVTDKAGSIAICNVIGYPDKDGKVRQMRVTFDLGTEVVKADEKFIKKVLAIESKRSGAYIGMLDGKNIKIKLDMKKLLTKHISILAKTGAGKSYIASVLIEEILDKKIPLLIIDPHGEYSTLTQKNDNENDLKRMARFDVEAKDYRGQVQEFGDINIDHNLRPLRLNDQMSTQDIIHLMPGKLTSNQMSVLYSALKHLRPPTITGLMIELESEDNNAKWNIMNAMDHIDKMNIFSSDFTQHNDLIQPGRCSIINLRGIEPEIQEIIVYKLLKDLFEDRKKSNIPPFFAVIEEAHNFCPERGIGTSKASAIIRTIASEGRKFGLGLCVITQRPARVDKSVLSQCNTQIILKVTNPNDLKAIMSSVEGVSSETEDNIKTLPIGTAMITGVVDTPLFVNIRPKKSKHGGEAVDILGETENTIDMLKETKKFAEKDILPIIRSRTTIRDIELMSELPIDKITTYLIPAVIFTCKDKDNQFSLLFDLIRGDIIIDVAQNQMIPISKAKMNLSEHETFEKIEFVSTGYDKKLTPKLKLDRLQKQIESEVKVIDAKECFIVYHKPTYKEK